MLGCSAGRQSRTPHGALQAYAAALEAGHLDEAYALLSAEAKREISPAAFSKMVQDNPAEMQEIIADLRGKAEPAELTAVVTTRTGQQLLLVYEGDQWKVEGGSLDLYGQGSARDAVKSFLRAFDNQRYDVLMRFVPDAKREGLSALVLQKAWQGEQKHEIEQLVSSLKAAVDTAPLEVIASRATLSYGSAGTLELIEEGGLWKIEEF